MKVLHVTRLQQEGVQWHVGLGEVSRRQSPTGLALVFSAAEGPRAGSSILWPVSTKVLEDLLESIQDRSADRLAQELETALRWHHRTHDDDPSPHEFDARPLSSSRAREHSR